MKMYDIIQHVKVTKFNPHHDHLGRFTSKNGGGGSGISVGIDQATSQGNSGGSSTSTETKQQKISRLQGSSTSETIKNVEAEHRNNSIETLTVIDSQGRITVMNDGDSVSCRISREDAWSSHNKAATHNHPSTSNFSAKDIYTTVICEFSEFRATKRDGGAYVLKRMEGKKGNMSFYLDYEKHRDTAIKNAKAAMDSQGIAQKIKSGQMTQQQANEQLNRLFAEEQGKWLSENAEKYGYTYSEE